MVIKDATEKGASLVMGLCNVAHLSPYPASSRYANTYASMEIAEGGSKHATCHNTWPLGNRLPRRNLCEGEEGTAIWGVSLWGFFWCRELGGSSYKPGLRFVAESSLATLY